MYILFTILIIIAIPLILALFLQNEYVIERSIIIDKSSQEVFNYIKLLRNSVYYNKWVMLDPDLKKDFKGTDGTVGFIYYWDSNNKQVGKGEQEITGISEGNRVDYEIRFKKPFEGSSAAYIITVAKPGNQTEVSWVFKGTGTYMMKLMHLLLNLKKVLGNDLATSLLNLKTVLEKQ